jgi:hypothetical protein
MVLCDDRSAIRVIESFNNIDEDKVLTYFLYVSDKGTPYFPILEI